MKPVSVSELATARARLGEINFVRFDGVDFVRAHYLLGEDVSRQAQKILRKKLDRIDKTRLIYQIRVARRCRQAIALKIESASVPPKIRDGLKTYLDCLAAWAAGAALASVENPKLQQLQVDGNAVSSIDLALLLQDDNVGCQTGVYRTADGSAILWHTEEDGEKKPNDRFDRLRIAVFSQGKGAEKIQIYAFIYPDLLPGPAFNWRSDGFVQAVDALYIKKGPGNGGMLANLATWLTLYLGPQADITEIIGQAGPYYDGYALNVVRKKDQLVSATKIEFAGEYVQETGLADQPGSYLFQVNLFSDKHSPAALSYEDIDAGKRDRFEKRRARTERMITLANNSTEPVRFIRRLLCSRSGASYAYANTDVKAHLIANVSDTEMRLWPGSGPASGDTFPPVIICHSSKAES